MITVEFKDFEEMKCFAREILGVKEEKSEPTVTEPDSAVPPAAGPISGAVPVQTPPSMPPQAQTAVPVQTPVQQTPPAPVAPPVSRPAPVPTSNQTYVLDDLARAAITLMDSGRQSDLMGLLSWFGVDSLPALPKEQYGAFATALRGMGARI